MDICLPELAQTEEESAPALARELLADTWVVLWLQPKQDTKESERAAHVLSAALPLVTTEEARLN